MLTIIQTWNRITNDSCCLTSTETFFSLNGCFLCENIRKLISEKIDSCIIVCILLYFVIIIIYIIFHQAGLWHLVLGLSVFFSIFFLLDVAWNNPVGTPWCQLPMIFTHLLPIEGDHATEGRYLTFVPYFLWNSFYPRWLMSFFSYLMRFHFSICISTENQFSVPIPQGELWGRSHII